MDWNHKPVKEGGKLECPGKLPFIDWNHKPVKEGRKLEYPGKLSMGSLNATY